MKATSDSDIDTPMSLSPSTAGTFQRQTAWRTPRSNTGLPVPYSKKTAGTTYKWDDDTMPTMPASDRGVGR